jgi:serine/threonine protein kinase
MRAQTNPTESVGSPHYMSPEQITTPSEVDARTDIWSLGVVMYELLTGAIPFNGPGPAQVCASVLTDAVPPLADHRDDVPPALEAIVLRCLEKNRERRFTSITEVESALRALELPTERHSRFSSQHEAVDLDVVDDTPVRPRRRWVGALVGIAVLGCCGAVLAQGVRQGQIRVPSQAELKELPSRLSGIGQHLKLPAFLDRNERGE